MIHLKIAGIWVSFMDTYFRYWKVFGYFPEHELTFDNDNDRVIVHPD